ncbi:MAG: hypothetical protein RR767_13955 [Acinetobacter sp.]
MSLYESLKKVKSEEDVKDAYIKALGLKSVSKGLIDIQTDEIWFEAKDKPQSTYAMFTQLLHYVNSAIKKGNTPPPFLAVIDTHKAALMKTSDIMPLFNDKTIKWGESSNKSERRSASQFTKETLEKVSTYIGTHFVSFRIDTHEREFIDTVKLAIKSGEIVRTQITPDNLKQVFDKWVALIGREIAGVADTDYALLFFADIMHDGKTSTHENLPARLLHDGEKPLFLLNGKTYELGSHEGYRQFWMIYHKPPKAEYRNYLMARRDNLIPFEERSFKGAYYTPLAVVDKAYDLLTETLGKNWQKNYIVWDMCCGVGNLEVKHSNPRNVFMSTLDQADIDVMKASKTCVAATRFQYDYLNDDITDDGKIDYNLTNKVPQALQQAIKDGRKLLILINPPYAEAANRNTLAIEAKESNKAGVAKTRFALNAMSDYGKASNELFIQFVARVAQEIPTATIAMFSTLKYVNAPNFEVFRQKWNSKYLGGFVIHNKAFDGLRGNFPIGFLIWKTDQIVNLKTPITKIQVEVLNRIAQPIGEKTFYNFPNNTYLNVWLTRPKSNDELVIPLKNTITPYTAKKYLNKWSNGAIGYMWCQNNDFQHAEQQTVLFSSTWGDSHGFYVTPTNLWQTAVIFSVRRLFSPTWLNDRDQFLQPSEPLTNEFKDDCLVWMLFHRCNQTASANDLEWNDRKWSIVNHFIPFTESEVGAPDRFESDFMVQYLQDKKLSNEAKAVLREGKKLWQAYFSRTDEYSVRDTLKLNRADVGWYQVRKALEARNTNGSMANPVDFSAFKTTYDTLSDKLRPQVFELGFLKD